MFKTDTVYNSTNARCHLESHYSEDRGHRSAHFMNDINSIHEIKALQLWR